MGFWDSVGKAAAGVGSAIAENDRKVSEYAESYQSESDDYLKRKLKGGNMAEKMAATKVLKERGYAIHEPHSCGRHLNR